MQNIRFVRKRAGDLQRPPAVVLREKLGIPYFSFPILEETGVVRHLFSTRHGGVSGGMYASMNYSFSRGDDREAVLENFRRTARLLPCEIGDMVCADQTHTANIRKVTEADKGKGLTRPKDYSQIDGLVTDREGVCLALFFADCVPIYFVDPKRRAVGLAHSGWKGTAGGIGACTVRAMQEEYGCRPSDIRVAVGPSICQDCYEIGGEVAGIFKKAFPGRERQGAILKEGSAPGKYRLDLWGAVTYSLLDAGISKDHIAVADVCTCCNPGLLFSHRASKGRRGNLGAFLMLAD